MNRRIVLLSTFLSPWRSGAEACAEEVAFSLGERFDITIVTARLRRTLPRRDTLRGRVSVIRVGWGCSLDKWLFPFLAALAVRRLRPDVVHAILESYAGAALILCRALTQATCILTCQSTNTRFLLRRMHAAAHYVTVISSALLRRAARFGRSDAVLIPNGLHVAAVPQRGRIVGRVLFVGRLVRVKGVDTLLKALAKLPPHSHLRIVGEGKAKPDLMLLATRLHIRDRVEFLGYIPTPDVYEEYAKAEVFCGLSRSEALGNVFLEAQAAGCAVVAANVGGIPDIVQHEKTGLLVPPNDPDAAARAIAALLDDDQLRRRLGEAGRKNAQSYDWASIAERYAALYTRG